MKESLTTLRSRKFKDRDIPGMARSLLTYHRVCRPEKPRWGGGGIIEERDDCVSLQTTKPAVLTTRICFDTLDLEV